MEGVKASLLASDSSGGDLSVAQTYFFGHPLCVRRFYRALIDRKLVDASA